MHKEEVLRELQEKIVIGEISREEVGQLLGSGNAIDSKIREEAEGAHFSFSLTKILYILGAIIMVVGIILFVGQIWDDIEAVGRILVTLGIGLLFAGAGSSMMKQKPDSYIGTILHFAGGVLIPSGALVTIYEISTTSPPLGIIAMTFGAISGFYLLLNSTHKNALLTFFAIANGTTFLYVLIEAMLDGPFYRHDDVYAYLTIAVGASYLLLAHSFKDGWNKSLIGVLFFFGSAGVLGAAYSRVFDSVLWEIGYLPLVLGGLALSAYLKGRSILVFSTLFLIAYVTYITSEYFADSVGWPISLVVLGMVVIGLAYGSIAINKKFISSGEEAGLAKKE